VISANLRIGDVAAAARLMDFIQERDRFDHLLIELQRESLACLAVWRQVPLVDRVEGRIRRTERIDPDAGKQVLAENIGNILKTSDDSIIDATLTCAAELEIPIPPDLLKKWVVSSDVTSFARSKALQYCTPAMTLVSLA
jgi:hypothetical protein